MKLQIAQIKAVPKKGDLQANHEKLVSLLRSIEPEGIDVVITPECFLDGYVSTENHVTNDNIADYGVDPCSSRYVSEISDWSARANTWIVFGCTRVDSGVAYNSALVLNRKGKIVGTYDKVDSFVKTPRILLAM